uniref:ATP synthase complex subunit 8 n=1 Tax=Lycocerus asperipennis TaxID=2806094 RepID=A0A7U1BEG0_9COLE|nr:ATP synthase F0 subunit 8 [Lycocerus asperipennis]QQY97877.1 ATP synthase F0 subunit 8 [Lycocerus asperipennis]
MPQMAPLSWLNLFIFFITVFLIFNSLNYFYFNKSSISQDQKKIKTQKKITWKW